MFGETHSSVFTSVARYNLSKHGWKWVFLGHFGFFGNFPRQTSKGTGSLSVDSWQTRKLYKVKKN